MLTYSFSSSFKCVLIVQLTELDFKKNLNELLLKYKIQESGQTVNVQFSKLSKTNTNTPCNQYPDQEIENA